MCPSEQSIPQINTNEYGAVDFDGEHVPCAFGGESGNLTAFILVDGVCQIVGIPSEGEVKRIQDHHLLKDGLYMVSFPTINDEGKVVRNNKPAITLQRLHAWLALIPPDIVSSEVKREKLINTQNNFSDVVYAFFGRRLLPEEIREEDDPYLDENRKKLYSMLEEASKFNDRLASVEDDVAGLRGEVNRLSITISAGEGEGYINADQQEQLKAMMDLLGNRYEKKHGKGTRGGMINDIKNQHDFRFYNTVTVEQWPDLVRDCAQRCRQLSPKGATLPHVFQIALRSVEQKPLL